MTDRQTAAAAEKMGWHKYILSSNFFAQASSCVARAKLS